MSFTVSISELPGVTGVSGMVLGGGDIPAGTYYIAIVSVSNFVSAWPFYTSDPVIVGPYTVNGIQAIMLFWTGASGAQGYNVYLGTSPTDFSGSYFYSSGASSLSTTQTNVYVGQDHYLHTDSFLLVNSTDKVPGGIDRQLSVIDVDFYGSGDFEDLYDAIVAAGYGDHCYFDSEMLVVLGNLNMTGSNLLQLEDHSRTLCLLTGIYSNANSHADSYVRLGVKGSNELAQNGCRILSIRGCPSLVFGSKDELYNPRVLNTRFEGGGNAFNASHLQNLKIGSIGAFSGGFFDNVGVLNLEGQGLEISNLVLVKTALYGVGNGSVLTNIISIDSDGASYTTLATLNGSYLADDGCVFQRCQTFSLEDGTGNHLRVVYDSADAKAYFDDCYFNSASGKPNGLVSTYAFQLYFRRTFNVVVLDENGDPLSGVTVDLVDQYGTSIWPTGTKETDASGSLSSNELVIYWFHSLSVSGWKEYGPFTLTLSKTDYDTQVIEGLNLDGLGVAAFLGTYAMVPTVVPDLPSEDDVRDQVVFDNGAKEGNLVLPAPGDIEEGVASDSNGSVPGTFVVPIAAEVKSGVGFGEDGAEFEGILVTQTIGPSVIKGAGGPGRVECAGGMIGTVQGTGGPGRVAGISGEGSVTGSGGPGQI